MYRTILILSAATLAGPARAQVTPTPRSCVAEVSAREPAPDLATVDLHISARALGQLGPLPIDAGVVELIVRHAPREPMPRPTPAGEDPRYVLFQIITGPVPRYLRLDLTWRAAADRLWVNGISLEAPGTPLQQAFARTGPLRGSEGRLTASDAVLAHAQRERIGVREIVDAYLNPYGPPVRIGVAGPWIVGKTREGRPLSLNGTERAEGFHLLRVNRATLDQQRVFISRSGAAHDDPAQNQFTIKSGLFRKRLMVMPPGILRKITQINHVTFAELREALEKAEALIFEAGERASEPRFWFVARLDSGKIIRIAGVAQADGAIAILEGYGVDEKTLTTYHLKRLNKAKLVHL